MIVRLAHARKLVAMGDQCQGILYPKGTFLSIDAQKLLTKSGVKYQIDWRTPKFPDGIPYTLTAGYLHPGEEAK